MHHTIEHFVGNTPLVRLKRIPGATSNVLLAKLEGNNPAGSVKDRPALSMITQAEKRGDISPVSLLCGCERMCVRPCVCVLLCVLLCVGKGVRETLCL